MFLIKLKTRFQQLWALCLDLLLDFSWIEWIFLFQSFQGFHFSVYYFQNSKINIVEKIIIKLNCLQLKKEFVFHARSIKVEKICYVLLKRIVTLFTCLHFENLNVSPGVDAMNILALIFQYSSLPTKDYLLETPVTLSASFLLHVTS